MKALITQNEEEIQRNLDCYGFDIAEITKELIERRNIFSPSDFDLEIIEGIETIMKI
jgi:hypothetical protein